MKKVVDVLVIGLGAMGSAALRELANRKVDAIGIDERSPPHCFGSSHGDTRITRQAIGEGEEYVPLVLRSYELFREAERETGETLLEATGGLIMASQGSRSLIHGTNQFLEKTIAAAKKYAIQHEVFSASEIRQRFGKFRLVGDETGYYEYHAGFLRPERCIMANLMLAERYGAAIHRKEKVIDLVPKIGSVTVRTTAGEYSANTVILSAGAWVPKLLDSISKKFSTLFTIYRQTQFWFDIEGPVAAFQAPRFPIFIWNLGEGQSFYGFPAIDGEGGGVKVAAAQYKEATNPDTVRRWVSKEEVAEMHAQYIKDRLPGLRNKCRKAISCLYTVTTDSKFIIDFHPDFPNIIVASPCSGHGFKHSAAIGEVLAEFATTGKSTIDTSAFSFKRFM